MNTNQIIIEPDIERQIESHIQLQNRNISPHNNYQERDTLYQALQRERIRNLQIDSVTNIFICIGIMGSCVFIGYFVASGNNW